MSRADPFSDVRQMTPEAQHGLGGYVRALLDQEAILQDAILRAGTTSNRGVDKIKSQVRGELIRLHTEKYACMLSGNRRQARRQVEEMAALDIDIYVRRAQAALDAR